MAKAIVIGAGVSGLAASCILSDQGYDVLIFEKSPNVGGRVKRGSFSDGSQFEIGATWLHDSSHPVANLFTHGSYQDYNENKEQGFLTAMSRYYVGKPIVTYYIKNIEALLFSKREHLFKLNWEDLIDKIIDSENNEEYIAEIREYISSFPYNLCFDITSNDFKKNILNYLQESGTDTKFHSIVGGQLYLGSGDENYLPAEGYSKVIDHLLSVAEKKGVKIQYDATVKSIKNNGSVLLESGELYKTDRVISAIAPFDYETLNIDDINQQETLDNAIKYLCPSGRSKMTIKLNKEVYIDKLEHVHVQLSVGNSNHAIISTSSMSDIVYVLYNAVKQDDDIDIIKKEVTAFLNLNYSEGKEDINIIESRVSFKDGKSWYHQYVGFKPIDNKMNPDVQYLGVLTGCDDSVHSSITAACKELTTDVDKCLQELF